MKKIIYFLCYIILLFLISIIPTSAKEFKTCTRSETNLHVIDKFIKSNNINDIMSTPCVDYMDKVYDYAGLLTEDEENNLYNEILNYIEISNYDLAVVTIDNNPKRSEVEFADDFYDYNGFGKGETRDGLLLLIDMDNRRVYISTNGYAIQMYTDSRIDSIIDSGYYNLKNEEYYNCLSNMIKSLHSYFNEGVPEINKNMVINEYGRPVMIKYMNYKLIGFISGIITLIVAIVFYNISRLKIKVSSTVSYLKDKKITNSRDTLVNTIVTHTYRSTDSGSGSSSGGSSYHSSSSGSFHGGGGRGF